MQGIQPLLPQGPVPAQPFIDVGQRLGAKSVDPPLRLLANLDEPRLPQHPQMPLDPRAGNWQQRRQVARGCRAAGQGLEQRPPALVRQSSKNRFHVANVPSRLRTCQVT